MLKLKKINFTAIKFLFFFLLVSDKISSGEKIYKYFVYD